MPAWLKPILGEAHTEDIDKQVDAELGKSYVARTDYDTVKAENKTISSQLKQRDTQLAELKKTDPEKLQAEITRLQQENKKAAENHAAEMARIQKTTALRLAFADKLHDPDDAIRNMDLEKVELTDDGKLKSTADELLSPFKDTKAHWFKPATSGPEIIGAHQIEGADLDQVNTDYQSRLDEARKSGNTTMAVQIKSEAADKGINLR